MRSGELTGVDDRQLQVYLGPELPLAHQLELAQAIVTVAAQLAYATSRNNQSDELPSLGIGAYHGGLNGVGMRSDCVLHPAMAFDVLQAVDLHFDVHGQCLEQTARIPVDSMDAVHAKNAVWIALEIVVYVKFGPVDVFDVIEVGGIVDVIFLGMTWS